MQNKNLRVIHEIDTASFGGDDIQNGGKLHDIIENTSTENASSAKVIQRRSSKVSSLENGESLVTIESKKKKESDELLKRFSTFAPA